ncbi:MAG: ACP S-malonyltransferase, partial [Actinobacteria bacterium]|nr:ACP S-malonyltransferase [Actinomycetota bacterium]
MSVAVVFPGQGSHRAGMVSSWEGHPAYATFAEVGAAAGIPDLPRLADDPDACAATAVGQPAMFAAGIAAWRALSEVGVRPHAVAGHSLGEVTAAVAAGVMSVEDGATLVAERGRSFAAACRANPGGMAAVLGLGDEIHAVLADHPRVELANDNGPSQKVLAGPRDALAEALISAKELGGRVRELDVEGAFHTAAMAPAVVTVDTVLRRTELHDPAFPLVCGDWVTV